MSGENFKYILAVGALAVFVYTSPAVADSIVNGMVNIDQQAAAGDVMMARAEMEHPEFHGQRFMGVMATTTRPIPLNASSTVLFGVNASSTKLFGEDHKGDMKGEQMRDRGIPPQDVVTLLYKAGLITSDNLAQARRLVEQAKPVPPPFASSTVHFDR